MLFFPAMVATYAAYLWRLEHLGHNWNLIMASPVPPLDLFTAKFAVVAKLALLTHSFVFALFVFCGKVFAQLPGLPPVTLPLYLLRGLLGALAVIAAQLVLAMGHTQLCSTHLSGPAGRHYRHLYQLQRLWTPVALFSDATRYELQQKCGYSGGQLRAVCLQLHLLAGDDVPSGMAAAAPAGCARLNCPRTAFLLLFSISY